MSKSNSNKSGNTAMKDYLVSSHNRTTGYYEFDTIHARNPEHAGEMVSDLSGGNKVILDVNPSPPKRP